MLFYILSSGIELTLWLGYKAVYGTYYLIWPPNQTCNDNDNGNGNDELVKEIELLRCEIQQLREDLKQP